MQQEIKNRASELTLLISLSSFMIFLTRVGGRDGAMVSVGVVLSSSSCSAIGGRERKGLDQEVVLGFLILAGVRDFLVLLSNCPPFDPFNREVPLARKEGLWRRSIFGRCSPIDFR